jgi:DNA-binding CsgD family transcriptional regulator
MRSIAVAFWPGFSEVVNPRVLGLAFHRAWIATFFFSANVYVFVDSANQYSALIYPLSLGALVFVLLCGGLLPQQMKQLMLRTPVRIGAPCLMSAGSLLPVFAVSTATPLAPVLCGLLTGIGSGLLLLYWAEFYGQSEPTTAQVHTVLAFVLAIIIYTVFLIFSSSLFYTFSGVLLPLFSGLALMQAQRQKAPATRERRPIAKGEINVLRVGLAALVISFVHATAIGDKQISAPTAYLPQSMQAVEIVYGATQLASTLILGILIIFTILILRRSDMGFIYRFVLLFLLASVLFSPFLDSATGQLASILINVGYSCFELIFWIALSNISYRYHIPPLQVFGLGRTGWVVGVFLGGLYPPLPFMELLNDSLLLTPFFTESLLIMLLVLTYAFILPERSVVAITTGYGGRLGSLKSRCQQLASQFALTQRETEVLAFLIKGRDTLHIQQALNISAGTVSTHRQRIYQKTGVHSRQELLDLLETTQNHE